MSDVLEVEGYAYDSVVWRMVAPAAPGAKMPRGYHLPTQLWKGECVEAEVPAIAPGEPSWFYVVKVETTTDAIEEARQSLGPPLAKQALGVARMLRFKGAAKDAVGLEHRIALEGLDEAHLIDRLTGAVLKWHAQELGPGPLASSPKETETPPRRRRGL